MDEIDATAKALHRALKYAAVEPNAAARVVVALFGLTHSKRPAPMLEELAHRGAALSTKT